MTYKFEKVIDGIARYINAEIYTGMNDLQEMLARIAVGRVINNEKAIKESLMNNGIIRTFGLIDNDGMVDVEGLRGELKREIERKGKISISIPMFGKLTFTPDDVDVLCRYITEG